MKTKLRELCIYREARDGMKDAVDLAQERLEATPEYKNLQALKNDYADYKIGADELAQNIKEDAVNEFVSTGLKNTKPYDGIQIKKFSTVHILDKDDALEWAVTNAPEVVSLNKTKFNKVAKVLSLPFVQITTEYRAQIASDLSQYENSSPDTPDTAKE